MKPFERVGLRYLLARQALEPALRVVETLVKRLDFEGAQEALLKFISALGVRLHGGELRFWPEWAHSLDRADRDRFEWFLRVLDGIKNRIDLGAGIPARRVEESSAIEKALGDIHQDLRWIEGLMRDEADEIHHGPFKILLTEGAGDGLKEAIETLDEAAKKIQATKFAKVVYGKVYVRRGTRTPGTFEQRPGGGVAGSYVASGDFINLSLYATPDRNSVMTLIHEFGHRYQMRFMSRGSLELFERLSTVGPVESFSLSERSRAMDEYAVLWKHHQEENFPDPNSILSARSQLWAKLFPREDYKSEVLPLLKRYRDEKDESALGPLQRAYGQLNVSQPVERLDPNVGPVAASPYGATDWKENFAESFLAYVMRKPLPDALQKFMDEL